MKKRMKKIVSNVALLLVATSGLSAFVFFVKRGEYIEKWIPAALFFLIFFIISIIGLITCCVAKEEDL